MSVSPSLQLIEQRIRNRVFEYFLGVVEYLHAPGAASADALVNEWQMNVDDPFNRGSFPAPAFSPEEVDAMEAVHIAWLAFADSTPPSVPLQAFDTPEWWHLLRKCSEAIAVFNRRGRLSEDVELIE